MQFHDFREKNRTFLLGNFRQKKCDVLLKYIAKKTIEFCFELLFRFGECAYICLEKLYAAAQTFNGNAFVGRMCAKKQGRRGDKRRKAIDVFADRLIKARIRTAHDQKRRDNVIWIILHTQLLDLFKRT